MEATPPRLPDRSQTRAWLLTNLLVLPGLGSVLGGRRRGWLQMILALGGFGLTAWWATLFVVEWVRDKTFPLTGGSHLAAGLIGVLLFIIAWVWGLVTGLNLLRTAPADR